MISESVLYATSGVAYAATLAVLGAWLRRIPDRLRRLCHVVVLVVGVGAATSFLAAAGVGSLTVSGRVVYLPNVASDAVAYSLLWFVTASLAGVSRRTLALVTGLPVAQVLAFQFGASAGGLVGLGSTLVVVGGHLLLAHLFVGPIWRSAADLPDERRLLHWKARNLLLFLVGMLIAFAFLSITGAFTDFGTNVINRYISVLIRVGFAGFLFANVGALDDGRGEAPEPAAASAGYGAPAPDAGDD